MHPLIAMNKIDVGVAGPRRARTSQLSTHNALRLRASRSTYPIRHQDNNPPEINRQQNIPTTVSPTDGIRVIREGGQMTVTDRRNRLLDILKAAVEISADFQEDEPQPRDTSRWHHQEGRQQ